MTGHTVTAARHALGLQTMPNNRSDNGQWCYGGETDFRPPFPHSTMDITDHYPILLRTTSNEAGCVSLTERGLGGSILLPPLNVSTTYQPTPPPRTSSESHVYFHDWTHRVQKAAFAFPESPFAACVAQRQRDLSAWEDLA